MCVRAYCEWVGGVCQCECVCVWVLVLCRVCLCDTHTYMSVYVRMVLNNGPWGITATQPHHCKHSTCRAMFQIRRLTELDHLAGCSSLKQLFLADNPAVGYYKDFTALAGWEPSLHTVVCGSPEHCSGVRIWVWGGSCRCRTNTH